MNFSKKCGIIFLCRRNYIRIYLSREDSRLFQVVSNSKFVSVGVRSPNEINAPQIYYFKEVPVLCVQQQLTRQKAFILEGP